MVKVVAVQLILKWGNPHCQHILMFRREKLSQLGVIFPLRTKKPSKSITPNCMLYSLYIGWLCKLIRDEFLMHLCTNVTYIILEILPPYS